MAQEQAPFYKDTDNTRDMIQPVLDIVNDVSPEIRIDVIEAGLRAMRLAVQQHKSGLPRLVNYISIINEFKSKNPWFSYVESCQSTNDGINGPWYCIVTVMVNGRQDKAFHSRQEYASKREAKQDTMQQIAAAIGLDECGR